MKEYAGKILMLVENYFPGDPRVRNEAFTLSKNGYKVTVVALRSPGEGAHQILDGISIYRIPKLTLFKKLPSRKRTIARRILRESQSFLGYLFEYSYFTSACILLSLYIALKEGFDVVHAHNPPDTLFLV